jgi:hypothetical protein
VALNTGGSATTNFCSPVTLSAGQMVRVQYDTIGTCWAPLAGGIIFPARILTFYVATTGSDSNNCLSASTACLTLQHAFGVAMTYDAGNSSIVISLGAGTFDGGYFSGVIRGNAGTGISGQYLFIQGAGPTTIVTNTGGRVATLGFSNGMAVELVNLKVNALSGTYGVFAQNPGTVVELGAGLTLTGQTGAVAALHGEAYALIEMASVGNTLTITGDFTQLATLGASGYLEFDPAGTGTIACSGLTIHNQLFDLSDLANMLLPAGWAFSGCPSGSQSYLVERGAVLTNLTGSPIPGTAGANINGGQYCSPTCTIGTGGQLVGTKTNDAAAPGNIGELISNVARDTTATVTITNASPAVITWTTNNFSTTQTTPVQFTTTGTLPSPLAIGTTYWTIPSSVTANTFQLATTVANAYVGTAINTTTNGGPTHTGINAAFLASAVPSDISGLQLTAGDWDCNGTAVFLPAGTTTVNGIGGDIATSPGQLNAADQGSHFLQAVFTTGNEQIMPYGTARFSLAATTVIHFSGYASFGISTLSAFGAQRCRRMR